MSFACNMSECRPLAKCQNAACSAHVLVPNKHILTRPVNQLCPLELHCSNAEDTADLTSPRGPLHPAEFTHFAATEAQRRLGCPFDEN